ncbi:MAG: magnesium transporter [Chloroflexi bacterium]|nr:magnesium transporter [Chloroflexota bacterium]
MRETRYLLERDEVESALNFFRQIHPADQGDVLVEMDDQIRLKMLAVLLPDETAEIIEHIEPEDAVDVFEGVDVATLAQILDETSPDVAADILNDLAPGRSRDILEEMSESEDVESLLEHADDTAGGLMIPDYPVVKENISVANALDILRLLGPEAEDLSAVLVVGDEDKLVGTLSITRLALARPSTLVGDLMHRDFISVGPGNDQEESALLMQRYNLNQLPVVGPEGRLLGVILAEDMVDVVEEEATEDMYRMAGVAGERLFGPLRNSLRSRLPWLFLNLATTFLAAGVVSIFESTIIKVVALAVFLPIVAGQGGIGGTQTVTLVVRSMALGDLPPQVGLRLLSRELLLGLINGLLLGVVVGAIAFIWKGEPVLGLILGLAMLGNMVIAALAGAGVPLLLRRFKIDPAVSSAVFVTTFTDVLGFLLFLGLAAIFITLLV